MFPNLVVSAQQPDLEPIVRWPDATVDTLRTFFERVDVEEVLVGLDAPRRKPGGDEVAALSAILAPNIEGPFRFVQSQVRHEPYTGSVRGARGTLLAASGNSLDQTLLLAGLYRARGIDVRLLRGRLGWGDVVALIGVPLDGHSGRGDPWLRWIEMTADHWWLEVHQNGRWTGLDPSFAGTAVGQVVGRGGQVIDVPPAFLRATAALRIRLEEDTLVDLQMPLDDLIGTGVRVGRAVVAQPIDSGDAADPDATPDDVVSDDLVEGAPDEPLDEEVEAEARLAAALASVLVPAPVAPISLVLAAAGQTGTTAPLELGDLARIELEIEVNVPMGSGIVARIPFGLDPRANLSVVFASGAVSQAQLQARTAPLFDALSVLSTAEFAALEAWTVRTRGAVIAAPVGPQLEPKAIVPVIEAGDPQHPATALHIAALRAWQALETDGLDAIATALLVASESLRPPSRAYRATVRMAAVHWTPPAADSDGRLTVWTSDVLRLSGLERNQRSAISGAYGLLQSALTGQVLNRVADRPPVTAFDVTLRAVGTGGRLHWWLTDDGVPELWPARAQVAAQADLASGRILAGLEQPVDRDGETLHGWWGVLGESGQTLARVLSPSGIAQAFVRFARPRDDMSLDSVLATLHDLHGSLRWLIQAASNDGQALASLLPGACAATPLVSDLLRAGAPPGTVSPAFEAFCAAQP